MAEEFRTVNSTDSVLAFQGCLEGAAIFFEPHLEFKKRVPHAIGLIRTGDTIQYANMILESA
jgi:D-ribose pyranase